MNQLRKVYYRAERDPSNGGKMMYWVPGPGVGFHSLKDLRQRYPADRFELIREKAKSSNRLFA